MRRLPVFIALVIQCAIFITFIPFVFGEIRNRVIAIVNEDLITLHELNIKIKQMTGFDPEVLRTRDNEKYLNTRRKILDLMISEKISNEKIEELGINVTPEEIDATIERVKEDNQLTHEDLMAKLKDTGITYKKYKEQVKKELERIRLINIEIKSKIIIRENEIKQYYEKNKDEFTLPGTVSLAAIFLKYKSSSDKEKEAIRLKKIAEEIRLKIKDGESFEEMAKQYSEGPGAKDGGNMGTFKTTQLDTKLRQIVKNLSKGDISKPIPRDFGMQIIKVVEKYDAKVKSMDDVRNAIYDILYREEVNKRYSSWINELKEKAYTKITF
jgi:peptidyl-prolyl cis-trans isomerase SurA